MAFAPVCFIACKSNDTSEKIDFTKSYENAALALSSAQKNYDEAVVTKDTIKIKAAKSVLQNATASYISSKNNLVSHGGTTKPAYESTLTQSEESLKKVVETPQPTSVANEATTPASKVGQVLSNGNKNIEKASATIEKANKTVTDKINKANKTVEDLATKKAKGQAKIEKTKNDFNNTKKQATDEAKKFKSNLDNLLKTN